MILRTHTHPYIYIYIYKIIAQESTQLTIACSKSTIETLEKGLKHVQKLKIKKHPIYFTAFSTISFADFELVNVS